MRLHSTALPARPDPRGWITPENLNVAPELLGQPLARPWQRALAMGLDLALLSLLSHLGNVWLLLAFGWGVWRWVRLMLNLRRYGGYAAGLATGGLGFVQIF